MLLQTNSYIVPKDKRAEHARLMRRFRQILNRIGCDNFEVYEQVGANWSATQTTGRFVQIMRFRDRKHQLAVQNAERSDPAAQQLIAEFCELVNYPLQQQQQQFAVGFYSSVLPIAPLRSSPPQAEERAEPAAEQAAAGVAATSLVGDSMSAESTEAVAAEDESGYVAAITDVPAEPTPAEEASADNHAPEEWENPTPTQPQPEEHAMEPSQEEPAVDAVLEDELVVPSEFIQHPSKPLGDASPVIDETDALADAAPPTETPADQNAEPLSEDDLLGVVSSEPNHTEPHPLDAPANGDEALLSDDLVLGDDDDISRLAEELAADTDPHTGGHSDAATHGRPSENGAR